MASRPEPEARSVQLLTKQWQRQTCFTGTTVPARTIFRRSYLPLLDFIICSVVKHRVPHQSTGTLSRPCSTAAGRPFTAWRHRHPAPLHPTLFLDCDSRRPSLRVTLLSPPELPPNIPSSPCVLAPPLPSPSHTLSNPLLKSRREPKSSVWNTTSPAKQSQARATPTLQSNPILLRTRTFTLRTSPSTDVASLSPSWKKCESRESSDERLAWQLW